MVADVGIAATEGSHRQRRERVAHRCGRRSGRRGERHEALAPGVQNDEHAPHACRDDAPAPRGYHLAMHRHRQSGHEERGDHEQRVGLRHGEPMHGEHEAAEHADAERAAQQVQERLTAAQLRPGPLERDRAREEGERGEAAQAGDLHRAVMRGQALEQRVHDGEDEHRGDHGHDAAQAVLRRAERRGRGKSGVAHDTQRL